MFRRKRKKYSTLWNGVYPGSTYKKEKHRKFSMLWDVYLPPLLGLAAIGFVAYYFQLVILMVLFLGFITATLASAFGR